MPGNVLTTSSTVMCTHGASAMLTTANAKLMVDGSPALLESDVHSVAGCPFQIPVGPEHQAVAVHPHRVVRRRGRRCR